jgi:hypothetical protein
MDKKLKHLELIQMVVTRLAGNSFLIKGWAVTLVSALFALAAKDANANYVVCAYFPAIMFWCLDSYFLRQERLFRKLYDCVRAKDSDTIDFSMDTSPFVGQVASYSSTAFSITLGMFYGTILGTILVVMFVINCLPRR